ncbi:hypothetical protein ACIF85_02230 [Streptomyces sp. NPDC086033]|uniref:hypothetical protein n=1 Tax=Streptomyces sp. NPDC086033 TaxID=3365747 RepID=UPI0037CF9687
MRSAPVFGWAHWLLTARGSGRDPGGQRVLRGYGADRGRFVECRLTYTTAESGTEGPWSAPTAVRSVTAVPHRLPGGS